MIYPFLIILIEINISGALGSTAEGFAEGIASAGRSKVAARWSSTPHGQIFRFSPGKPLLLPGVLFHLRKSAKNSSIDTVWYSCREVQSISMITVTYDCHGWTWTTCTWTACVSAKIWWLRKRCMQFTVRLSRQFLSHLDVPIHRMETMPQKCTRRKSNKSKTKIRFGISGLLCFLLARSAAEIMSLRLTENAQTSTVSILQGKNDLDKNWCRPS